MVRALLLALCKALDVFCYKFLGAGWIEAEQTRMRAKLDAKLKPADKLPIISEIDSMPSKQGDCLCLHCSKSYEKIIEDEPWAKNVWLKL
jgi:hypothetical protein